MPPKYEDYLAFEAAHRAELAKDVFVSAGIVRTAAVSAEKLLGDPNWDRYLMRVQALLNESEKGRVLWGQRCTQALSGDDIRIAQLNYHACDARAKALTEVMLLPKELVDEGRGNGPEPR